MTPSMTSLPSFNTVSETLRYIEQRAEKAIAQELHVLMQSVLALRSQLLLDDRSHADTLLMTLDRLHSEQTSPAPRAECNDLAGCAVSSEPRHTEGAATDTKTGTGAGTAMTPPNVTHYLYLYDPTSGGMAHVFVADSFMQALKRFEEQVHSTVDCTIEATWCNGQPLRGDLQARTMTGRVVAQIQPAIPPSATSQAAVRIEPVRPRPNAEGSVLASASELMWPILQAA